MPISASLVNNSLFVCVWCLCRRTVMRLSLKQQQQQLLLAQLTVIAVPMTRWWLGVLTRCYWLFAAVYSQLLFFSIFIIVILSFIYLAERHEMLVPWTLTEISQW